MDRGHCAHKEAGEGRGGGGSDGDLPVMTRTLLHCFRTTLGMLKNAVLRTYKAIIRMGIRQVFFFLALLSGRAVVFPTARVSLFFLFFGSLVFLLLFLPSFLVHNTQLACCHMSYSVCV